MRGGGGDPAGAKVIRPGLLGCLELLVGLVRKGESRFGSLGPFSAEEIGSLIGSAFMGAESTYLLGVEKKDVPVRRSLRRIGDLLRLLEAKG